MKVFWDFFLNLSDKDWTFLIFGLLSVVILAFGIIYSSITRKTIKGKLGVTAWQFATGAAFLSALLMYVPVYYIAPAAEGFSNPVFPFVKSLFQTVRLFVIDSELDVVFSSLKGVQEYIAIGFSCCAILLFVVCPVLTAKLLLFVFKGFVFQLRLALARNKKIYIMSELNEMSVALAGSIRGAEAKVKAEKKGLIVFANVGKQEAEAKPELLQKATDLKAIYLKQDLASLNFTSKTKNNYEVFFISENETENLEKTIAFSELNREKICAKLFVYASTATGGYIVDSLDKDTVNLPKEILAIEDKDELFKHVYENGITDTDKSSLAKNHFDVRRIDYTEDFAINALKASNIFNVCKTQNDNKIISIMIVGLGKFGKELLKTALWYCQVPGYSLEINVVDCGIDKRGFKTDVLKTFEHECPEIIDKNKPGYDGDEGYDIKFFDADCFSSSLDELFETEKERLKKTQLVFVTLGSDDKNVDAAIEIRRQFDRMLGSHSESNKEDKERIKTSRDNDLPLINAVVFDDKKAKNIQTELKNHKDIPYHINTIGSLSEIYNYSNISDNQNNEIDAIRFHIEWIYVESKIREALSRCNDEEIIRKICECRGVDSPDKIKWSDNFACIEDARKNLVDNLRNYYQFEYFRNSSISKAIHKKMLMAHFADDVKCKEDDTYFFCSCDGCKTRRKIEHMRWSAFMRINGFCYNKTRWDRGKHHFDLIPTEELNLETQLKD